MSSDHSKRRNSKSALDYAKHFIKQVSNIPTEPSSKDQNQLGPEEIILIHDKTPEKRDAVEERQLVSERENNREASRKKHRNSIMEKLKSLKTIRTRSKHGSIEKNLGSLDKDRGKSPSKGNIDSLVGINETMLMRMKARSRNRRVVLRVRNLNQSAPVEQEMELMLSSLVNRSQSGATETADKVELHLELLNILPEYVKQFKQIYEEVDCWDELLFLTYKKFHLERGKVLQAIENITPLSSPFRLPFAPVSTAELREFNPSIQGIRLEERVRTENQQIEGALRELYNHIIEKSGRYINLLEEDTFSEEVYWLMGEEVRLLGEESNASRE